MIDITQLSSLITALRNETQSEAITPEMVGSLLQRIIDLLATAETSTEIKAVKDWYANAKNFHAIQKIANGSSDRNNVYLTPTNADTNGTTNVESDGIIIRQATTDRAGAMRAQQVIDLNNASKNITALQNAMNNLSDTVNHLSNKFEDVVEQIECEVRYKSLYLRGARNLIEKGYVPYLFRYSKKRNRYDNRQIGGDKGHSNIKKGWNRMGGHLALKIGIDELVKFNTTDHKKWNNMEFSAQFLNDFSCEAKYLVKENRRNMNFNWGCSKVSLKDRNTMKPRLVKLRFGIAFVKSVIGPRLPANMLVLATNIAEFYVVHNRSRFDNPDAWHFTI